MATTQKQRDNLIPIKKGELSSEEAKRRGAAGGKKSGETRRQKRDARQSARFILNLAAKGQIAANLKELGIPESDRNNLEALHARLFTMAMSGNLDAYKELMIAAGYNTEENRKERESIASDRRKEIELGAKMTALGKNPDAKVSMAFGDEEGNGGVMIYLPEVDKEEDCEVDEPDEEDD